MIVLLVSGSLITFKILLRISLFSILHHGLKCSIQSYFSIGIKIHLSGEAKIFFCPCYIQRPPRLSIWFCRIKDNFSFKTGQYCYLFRQVSYGNFVARADINRIGAIIKLGSHDNTFSCITRVNKFSRWSSIAQMMTSGSPFSLAS